MEDFLIGTTVLGKNRSAGHKTDTLSLKPGDNVYRVLPPMFSLAKANQYYGYWRIHWGFKMPDGKNRPLVCVERRNFRSKIIESHCPICDMVEERKREHTYLKESLDKGNGNVTKEQVKAFYDKNVRPFMADGKYYVNAVSQEGKIVVLKLPKTAKDAFEARSEKLTKEEAIDPSGVNGIYLNFIRTGEGKETKYSVEPYLMTDPNNPRAKVYKDHTLSPEFVSRLKTEARDLSKLYTPISLEDMSTLVSASEEERPVIMGRIFARPERDAPVDSGTVTLAPGLSGNISVTVDESLKIKVTQPEAPKAEVVTPKVQQEQATAQQPELNELDLEEFKAFMSRRGS